MIYITQHYKLNSINPLWRHAIHVRMYASQLGRVEETHLDLVEMADIILLLLDMTCTVSYNNVCVFIRHLFAILHTLLRMR